MPHQPPDVRASPVLPVADLRRSLEHYAALGFLVQAYDHGYGFAAWNGLELHFQVVPQSTVAGAVVYLHVPDAEAVAKAWSAVPGTTAPTEKPWHVREGTHVDPDGNLLRFGSPLRSDP
jgi:catechol 2,3-dioxygenase-like lactoylglutathione lyase family enzyme